MTRFYFNKSYNDKEFYDEDFLEPQEFEKPNDRVLDDLYTDKGNGIISLNQMDIFGNYANTVYL